MLRHAFRAFIVSLVSWVPFAATAVHVNPEGTGEILIYPYFTAQESEGNAYNTYLSIVNNTHSARALRVRLREGRNGREVASFNLMLGARDAWVAAIVPTPIGARLLTTDASCVAPELNAPPAPNQAMFLDLSPLDYSGSRADTFGTDVERLREGYAEVFEMAQLSEPPPSCTSFLASQAGILTAPGGGLSGTLTLINVQSGLDFTVNPVALADAAIQPYFRDPTDPYPDYSAAQIAPNASFFVGNRLARSVWNAPLDAVNAALLAERLLNEVVMDSGTRSGTDFVVTFPTKRLASPDAAPFRFRADGAREPFIVLHFTSREGEQVLLTPDCGFPCPPLVEVDLRARWAASVLSLRSSGDASYAMAGTSDVLGSRNGWLVGIPTHAQNGAIALQLDGMMEVSFPVRDSGIRILDGTLVNSPSWYSGLPAVGFVARTFRNGNLACSGAVCQGNYGGAFASRALRRTWPP
jgi:hypothetical protein